MKQMPDVLSKIISPAILLTCKVVFYNALLCTAKPASLNNRATMAKLIYNENNSET